MDDNHAYPSFTVDEIIRQLSRFTAEQRSLAWSPQPPFQSTGAGDCRVGGNCGLDFNHETAACPMDPGPSSLEPGTEEADR